MSIEIEAYADSDTDRPVRDDIMLVALNDLRVSGGHAIVPEKMIRRIEEAEHAEPRAKE